MILLFARCARVMIHQQQDQVEHLGFQFDFNAVAQQPARGRQITQPPLWYCIALNADFPNSRATIRRPTVHRKPAW